MFNGIFRVPQPINEPVLSYAPGTPERATIQAKLSEMLASKVEVPMIIDGKEVKNGSLGEMVCPHDHQHVLGQYHQANALFVEKAIAAADAAKPEWSRMPWDARAIIFLKAADLLAGKYRATINAATMLNMSKTPHQAEIDSACELIDFWRFNPHFMADGLRRPAAVDSAGRDELHGASARWTASCWRSPPSTSRRSPATCRPRRP